MNRPPSDRRRARERFFSIFSAVAVCLAVVFFCGLAFAEEPSPADASPPPVEPARLIEILEARRQLPDTEFLIRLLSLPDPRSRWLAVQDLGESGRTEFIPKLVPLLDDPNPEVRRRTRQALINLCYNQNGLYESYRKAMSALSPPGRLMAQAVWDDTKSRDRARQYYQQAVNLDPLRFWAAYHALPPDALVRRIREPVDREISRIEPRIDQYLSHSGTPVPLDELRDAFALAAFADAVDKEIARAALKSGNLPDAAKTRQEAADVLSGVRRLAEKAKTAELRLSQQGQGFMPSDFDPGLAESASLAQARALAAHELGGVNSPESIAALTQALETDPNPLVRVRAADSLGRLCPADVHQVLIRSVQEDSSADVRRAALIALGCRDSEASLRIIREYAQNPEYLDAAILASAHLGTDADLAFLFEQADSVLAVSPDDRPPSLTEPDDEPTINALITALKIIAPKRPDSDQPKINQYLQDLSQR